MKVPSLQKEEKKMGIKALIGKRLNREVQFMGEKVKIFKLSVEEVMNIQNLAKDMNGDDAKGFDILKQIIRIAVEDAADLTDADFAGFPMDELAKLSDEIMRFSGMANKDDKAGK